MTHIAQQVAQWKTVFAELSVAEVDMNLLAQFLDGPHLSEQRREPLA